MGARYYDPVLGRFISMDPVGFDETNLHRTAEVVPRTGNQLLGTARGAYVAVIGIAASTSAFQADVERAMSALEFEMCMLEDVRQVASEHDYASLDEECVRRPSG